MVQPKIARAKIAYVGLGANLGERAATLTRAKLLLVETQGLKLTGCSSLYETAPLGANEQPSYLNAAVELETRLGGHQLLGVLRGVESRLGRWRAGRWGPRTIDCDLLLVARDVIVDEDLILPHPELIRRAFALAPLVELAPGLRHPVTGLPLAAYFEFLGGQGVRRVEGLRW
jgi:2-amino-4-hydroxy-6-hydroxymethyldihydropteridine diphosphokinase